MDRGPLNTPPLETKTSQPELPAGTANPESAILAKNRQLKIIAILLGILTLAILISAIVIVRQSATTAPNKELIDYLENKRQEDIKEREGISQIIQQNNEVAAERQRRDSLSDMEQQRLMRSLSNFPVLYESNSYVFNLNAPGLQREYANFKP